MEQLRKLRNTRGSLAVIDTVIVSPPFALPVSAALLVAGDNAVAVEIHQASPTSSDISFNLVLSTAPPPGAPTLVRGPYLQLGTASSMIVQLLVSMPT